MIPLLEVIADDSKVLSEYNTGLDMIFFFICIVVAMMFYMVYFIFRWAKKHDSVLAEPALISDNEKV